jgi:ubiquitin-protein ligase
MFLSYDYPTAAPRLLFRSNFVFPSLADGRDCLQEVSGGDPWSPSKTLYSIVERLPRFIADYIKASSGFPAVTIGRFHLGE